MVAHNKKFLVFKISYFCNLQEDLANDVLKVFQLYKCSSKQEVPFTSVIYAYKGILLLFGLFLAWETRHVEVPALNDSKFIGMSVYNVGALSAVGIICMYALSGTASIKERYTIVSMCINLCTTVTLCLVFVPKVSGLMKYYFLTILQPY